MSSTNPFAVTVEPIEPGNEPPIESNLPAELVAPLTPELSEKWEQIKATELPTELPTEPPKPIGAETREKAIARLQSGLHEIRGRYLARRDDYEEKAEAAKAAKKSMEAAQDTLNDLVGELDEAIHGTEWQSRLPLDYSEAVGGDDAILPADGEPTTPAATGPDPAKKASIQQLVEHGVSQKQAEKLIDADIDTIAELEKRIREELLWSHKVKGIGVSAADKITDALIAWRDANGYGESITK